MRKKEIIILIAAMLVGLFARLPGVGWGSNFPPGWFGHHPDEYTHVLHTQLLINRYKPKYNEEYSEEIGLHNPWAAGYSVTPYPKGLAAHIAVPLLASRILTKTNAGPPPPSAEIIPLGRIVSVIYGTLTIAAVFILAKLLFSNPAIPILAAWIMALGGLHVTQSHFFLSDVPALFWFLLGLIFLWQDQSGTRRNTSSVLAASAFCFGVAFGTKLLLASIPSLGLAALTKPGRIWRTVLAIAFFQFGFFSVNAGMYTPLDFYNTVFRGISDTQVFPIWKNALLYVVELPSILSLPLFIASIAGAMFLFYKLIWLRDTSLQRRIILVIVLPLALHFTLVIFKLNNFPRHIIIFIPFFAISGAWLLANLTDYLTNRLRAPNLLIIAPFFLYLAVFVYDGEKGFIEEPRNEAAKWINENVSEGSTMWWYYHSLPGYKRVNFPDKRPAVIIEEMHHANHYLSGMGLRDSFPEDYRNIFGIESQEHVDAFQNLFSGKTEYIEAARFGENYFMPERILTNRLIGNRSLNYLAEVVVFVKTKSSGADYSQ